MKLATFTGSNGQRVAAVVIQPGATTCLLDLNAAHQAKNGKAMQAFNSMLDFIDAGQSALDVAAGLIDRADPDSPWMMPLESVRLDSPIPRPVQLRDFSVFEQHLRDAAVGLARLEARANGQKEPARESGSVAQVYRDYPLFYYSNRMNVSGSGVQIEWTDDIRLLDFELEIAAVIGRAGKDIPAERAAEHIFGYTIFNDVSARDIQWRQMKGFLGPCKAKSHDLYNVLGPWIVTRDELPAPDGLSASVRVNGAAWVETKLDGMVHGFDAMIAFASRHETVYAGEVFGSGTVGGCCGLEIDRWIKKGDRVELEVESIGTLLCHY